MITINLNNLVFYGKHGVYALEETLGSEFRVDVQLIFQENGQINSLSDTVDYTQIYLFVKQRMDQTTHLLETLAMDIGQDLLKCHPLLKFIRVDIQKVNAPIAGMIGNVGVSWFKNID